MSASFYAFVKFGHVLIAILALGTSAGLGIVLEFYGDHPTHGSFVLKMIKRLVVVFVIPGYVLMLATGLLMVHLSWSLMTYWIHAGMILWGVGIVLLALSFAAIRKQQALLDAGLGGSAAYRRVSLLGRAVGGGLGLVVVTIVYLMVVKPGD
jgi:hypothetical protein